MPTIDYEEIFEAAEVGIALNDPETGRVGTVNARYAELLGYDREELRDLRIEEISADDPSFDQAAAMAKIQRAREGESQKFDWLFERRDGSRFWGEVVLKGTTIGRQDRLLAFVRDATDRKQYERELEAKNLRLDEFAGIVSHDLKNPLNVAAGRLELAMAECDSEHLAHVADAHERMERLIEDLLTLARAGEAIGDTEPVELAAVVEDAVAVVDTGAATVHVDADATLEADERRLRELLENLLRNAVEHGSTSDRPDADDADGGSEGGVTVTIGDLPDGFYVEDDGPGIPPAERERVFEPGYTTATEGTGFGLSIVRDIAEAHGWSVDVTDGKRGGARFEVTVDGG